MASAHSIARASLVAALLLTTAACNEEKGIPGPPPMADGPGCMFSHACPDGTFCDLKQCTQECNNERPCENGLVCTARGRCASTEADPGDPPATKAEGVLSASPQVVRVSPDQGTFKLQLGGAGRVRVRLASDAAWLIPPFVRGEFEGQTEVPIAIDPSRIPEGKHVASLQVVSSQGDAYVVVHTRPPRQAVWQGSVAFRAVNLAGRQYETELGETRLGLHVRTDGAGLRAQIDPATSTLWPATKSGPVTAAGTSNPDGSMTFTFSALLDSESAMPLYPTLSPSVFRPERIGRELTLTLAIDEEGKLGGSAIERIHGLTSTPVELAGAATFLVSAGGALAEFDVAEPVAMPPGVKRGAGEAPSLDCPPAGTWPECAATASAADRWKCLVDRELPRGYLLSNFYDPGNPERVPVFSFTTSGQAEESPYASASGLCAQELPTDPRSDTHVPLPNAPPGGTACINLAAMSCARYVAATLFPERPELSSQGSFYVARAYLELFSMLGNESLVEAANLRLSAAATTSSIRTELLEAKRLYDAGLYRFFDPRLFEELRAITPLVAQQGPVAPIVVNDRAPLRLAARALERSESTARRAFLIDLTSATDIAQMHRRAQANAVLAWTQTALLADLGARWRGDGEEVFELTALGSMLRQLDELVASTTRGVTPLGFSRTYVPLLARTSAADVQTNFERMQAIAQTSVAASVAADATAAAKQREFDQSTELILQTLTDNIIDVRGQLQALCGNDFLDGDGVPRSDLSRCGVNVGAVRDAILAVDSAQLQLEMAHDALRTHHEVLRSRWEAYGNAHNLRAEEISFVTKTNKKILNLQIAQSALEATAALLSAAAAASESAKPTNTEKFNPIGAALHTAAGAAEAAAILLEPAKLRLEQMMQVNSMQTELEVTRIEDAQDLHELGLQFSQLELQVALQANEHARALNNLASLGEQVASLLDTYFTHQSAYARASTIGVDPSFRIEQSADALAADVALEQGKRDLYLAARALEYETNTDLTHIAQAIFRAPTGKALSGLSTCVSNAWNQWRLLVSSSNSYVTEISLAKDVLGIEGPVTDRSTGRIIEPGAQFRRYLLDQPYSPDALRTWPALRFGITLNRNNGLFSSLLCNDRIQGIEAKLVGARLTGSRAEVQVLADGSSQLRSCSATANEEQLVSWNLRPRGQFAPAILSAGINAWDDGTAPNQSLREYAVSQNTVIVALPDAGTSPANRDLDVTQVDDIVLRITHSGVAAGAATGGFHPTCN